MQWSHKPTWQGVTVGSRPYRKDDTGIYIHNLCIQETRNYFLLLIFTFSKTAVYENPLTIQNTRSLQISEYHIK